MLLLVAQPSMAPHALASVPLSPGAARKPWIAAMLSLWMPGLGHVYAGSLERGAIWCGLWWTGVVGVFALTAILPAWAGAFAPYILLIAGLALIATNAARVARRAARPFMLQPYNRWYVYIALPLFFGPSLWVPIRSLLVQNVYKAFRLPTDSMAPTMVAGDYIYTTGLRGVVRRGDNIVFHHDHNSFVKRVVGLAGDTLVMRSNRLFVNGASVSEPYVMFTDAAPPRATWGPIVVPRHTYFVLGDNRDNSLDSRYYGPIDVDSATHRPIGIYFSRDTAGAIRWSRIGRSVGR